MVTVSLQIDDGVTCRGGKGLLSAEPETPGVYVRLGLRFRG